jgi:hypothetical protein
LKKREKKRKKEEKKRKWVGHIEVQVLEKSVCVYIYIDMFSNNFKRERQREIKKKSLSYIFHLPSTYPHTCISWSDCMTCFLLGSGFWLCNICNASMPHFHFPTQSSTKALFEVGFKEAKQCLGEEPYTLSNRRESFEEQVYVLFWKSFKNPGYLSRRSKGNWILIHSIPQLREMSW